MANAALGNVLWHLRQSADRSGGATRSDGELLDRFRTDRDEAAFAALVHRHGPMVLGRLPPDAAERPRRRGRLPGHVPGAGAGGARGVPGRPGRPLAPRGGVQHGPQGPDREPPAAGERRAGEARRPAGRDDDRSDLREALDVELSRLPEKFRAAVVTCDLEGEALQEAARRLGCPTGTVASRLARARQMLRRSLARRGLGLAALLAPGAATAAVPSRLAMLTTRAATGAVPISQPVLALTQGVIRAMFLTKVKSAVAAFVAAGVLVTGIGNGSTLVRAEQDKPVKPAADPAKPVKPGADPAKPGEKPAKPGAEPEKPVKPGEKPAKPEGLKSPGHSGTLKAVDTAKGTIVVSTPVKGGGTNDETFTTGGDTKVYLDGKEAKLGDLKVGQPVSVKLTQDRSKAIGVSVDGPTLSGEVKEVDAVKHMIVVKVTTWPDKTDKTKTVTEDKTVKVGEDVRLLVEGNKKSTLADLKTGATVMVQISADGERAVMIKSPAKGGEPGLTGELKAVAADKKSVTVAVTVLAVKGDKSSARTEDKTIPLADNVKVAVEGNKQATVADLKVGSRVAVYLSKEGDKVVAISASPKGGGDKKPEKPVKPGTDPVKPVKPGGEKPNVEKPVKPAKP